MIEEEKIEEEKIEEETIEEVNDMVTKEDSTDTIIET